MNHYYHPVMDDGKLVSEANQFNNCSFLGQFYSMVEVEWNRKDYRLHSGKSDILLFYE